MAGGVEADLMLIHCRRAQRRSRRQAEMIYHAICIASNGAS